MVLDRDASGARYVPAPLAEAAVRVQKLLPSNVCVRPQSFVDESTIRLQAKFVVAVLDAKSRRKVWGTMGACGSGSHKIEMHDNWFNIRPITCGGHWTRTSTYHFPNSMPRDIIMPVRRWGEDKAALEHRCQTVDNEVYCFDEGDDLSGFVGCSIVDPEFV